MASEANLQDEMQQGSSSSTPSPQYVDGILAAVPIANKADYLAHAKQAAALFKDYGAIRLVEAWGDDIPEGEVTSLPMAVQCKSDEVVVLSWITWPNKAKRDKAWEQMLQDPRMQALEPMPFDGQRMIHGGFEILLDSE